MHKERLLVSFATPHDAHILESSGRWLTREAERQEASDTGDDPITVFGYSGIWNIESAPHRGIWVWEGELADIDTTNAKLHFKGSWRRPTEEEWECMRRDIRLWPGAEGLSKLERLIMERDQLRNEVAPFLATAHNNPYYKHREEQLLDIEQEIRLLQSRTEKES